MVRLAKKADPSGNYRVIPDGDFCGLPRKAFDLVLSAFAFDNIPGVAHREQVLTALRDLLAPCGRIIIVGSRPEVYRNEWASFTTQAFVENLGAKSGEPVRIVMTDVEDSRPVVDLLWTHEDYLALFEATRLHVVADFRPLGRPDDGMPWLTELSDPTMDYLRSRQSDLSARAVRCDATPAALG